MRNPESFSSSNNEEDSIDEERFDELPVPNFSSEVAKWTDGIDLDTKNLKPISLDLKDVYTQSELKFLTSNKTDEEAREIVRKNREALLYNNEKIDQMNNHVLDIAELSQSELELLYRDKNTSESDKSIISCIGIIRSIHENGSSSKDDWELLNNIRWATQGIYGFGIVEAREILKKNDSHFQILTKKERKEVPPGSIEDLASAALESFVMNPNYSNVYIADYDDYLYGIQLDCTQKTVIQEDGASLVKEKVDLKEFQERIIESMSWALVDEGSKNKEYSKEEYEKMREKSADLYADYITGHHYLNDVERYVGHVRVAGQNEYSSIYGYDFPDKQDYFWKRFIKRIRSNNDEVFRYSKELANAEMKPWVDKIDFDKIDYINNDKALNCEQKFVSITEYFQSAFDVQNLDEDGQSQPIGVKWFRFKESRATKAIKKLFNVPIENEDLPERFAGAFYSSRDRSINYIKPSQMKLKLTNFDIDTIAHEMWHAKQHELQGNSVSFFPINTDLKKRLYNKNDLAYQGIRRTANIMGNRDYYSQIMEREAYAIGNQVKANMERRREQGIGKKLLDIIFK